jgi:hypothetical protein
VSTESISTTPKPFAFVLMPFDEAFDDAYKVGIKPACEAAGAYCERVDEQIFSERILDRVYNQIAKADIVVADMTGRNANVFYEVGYAHALGKLTILLTQNADDIPFDLKHFPHIIYGAKIAVLRDGLEKRVKHFIDNPPGKLSEIKLDLELFLGEQNLGSDRAVYQIREFQDVAPTITIFNASGNTFAPGDFRVGLITGERFIRCDNRDVTATKLPSGDYLHMLPSFPVLLPGAYDSYTPFLLYQSGKELMSGEQETVTIRLFTRQGSRDYSLTINIDT